MGAPLGNQNGLKLKDPDLRQEAYLAFCDWLEKGKSPYSFTFRKDDIKCSGETIIQYIKDNRIEFPPEHKQYGYAKGYALWEQHVEDSALGVNEKANTASLQMKMRNTYGWDKKEQDEKESEDNKEILKKLLEVEAMNAELLARLSANQNALQVDLKPAQEDSQRSLPADQHRS